MMFKGRLQHSVIFVIAKKVGMDGDRLRQDMQAPEITDEIIEKFNLARALRVLLTGIHRGTHLVAGPSADIDFPKRLLRRAH
jgi:hypothetical protein